MPTVFERKEQTLLDLPVLLFDCTFRDGSVARWATHQVSVNGNSYLPRLISHSGFESKAFSEDGVDTSAKISVTLANADSLYSQLEQAIGFKGAKLLVRFAFVDAGTREPVEPPITIFRGTGNSPDSMEERQVRITFNNRMNFQRVSLPEVRIQKRCPWLFPSTAEQRLVSITGGPKAEYNPFFRCGYSPDQAGGVGNLNGTTPFTSCDYTRASCETRGMFRKDSANRTTARFGGIEFVPSATLVRSHGDKQSHVSNAASSEALYNDVVPLVYGTAWVSPPVTFARNDGNLTRFEVLLCAGETEGVIKVVVNDVEIPLAVAGRDMSSTGWYNFFSRGNRTGNFNMNFTDASGQPLGDPYGSMAYLSIVVPNRVQDGRSLPKVQVLMQGLKLPTYAANGDEAGRLFTNNPAWVLLDVLRRAGWDLDEIDLASFYETSLYCDDPITTMDLNGAAITTSRFATNLVLRRRRSAADIIRGLRHAAGLYLTFGAEGKLQLRQESTLAVQHPVKAASSNAPEALLAGWPAYEFGDGTTGAGAILRAENGDPQIRFFSRNAADTANRFSVEFQDAFNEYQQDSISLVDLDEVLVTGQETSATLPALGLPNFDQAARMTQLALRKSVRGNRYVEFTTSVRALGLQPGDLITLTYAKEGYLRQPFRILRIMPAMNYSRATITAQLHDEEWYVATAGDGPAGNGRQPRFELGVPRPISGDVTDPEGEPAYSVDETILGETDGGAQIRLAVGFRHSAAPTASRAGAPLVPLTATAESTGGTLPGGETYYYGFTGVDSDGVEGPMSFVIRATIPTGTATNRIRFQNLSFNAATVNFNVYRGPNPQQLIRIAESIPATSSFQDTGLAGTLEPPPDENYHHANFYWRLEVLGETPATQFATNQIGNSGLAMAINNFVGKTIRITKGKGRGQERRIAANTATAFTTDSIWNVIPDGTAKFVVVEPSWNFGGSSVASPALITVPNREGATIHLNGRAANAEDKECALELSPITRWRILGATGSLLDADVPPEPEFGVQGAGDGSIELLSISFPTLANTRSISAGTFQLHFWEELQNPSSNQLTTAIDELDTVLAANDTSAFFVGRLVQAEAEIMEVTEVNLTAGTIVVLRGQYGTAAYAHAAGRILYPLSSNTYLVAFARDFFGSPASGGFTFTTYLPSSRVAAASLKVTNERGDSPTHKLQLVNTLDFGLRTLQGGQITIQHEGWLGIADDATVPFVIESAASIRDVFAVVAEAPSLFPIVLRLRQDATELCTLTIPIGQTVSQTINGFTLAPLIPGALLALDIVSVGQTSLSSPGRDMTVCIRL